MAAFDGRFFQRRPLFHKQLLLPLRQCGLVTFFSTVAWPHCLKGGHFLWLLLSTAAAFDGRF
jgi:hypothetical protein